MLLFQAQNYTLAGYTFDLPESGKIYSRIPMVTPDVNFVNMLRYSMLAITLLPENSLSRKCLPGAIFRTVTLSLFQTS